MNDEFSRRFFMAGAGGLAASAASPSWAQQRIRPTHKAPGVYVTETPAPAPTIQPPETSAALFIDLFGAGDLEFVRSIPELQANIGGRTGVDAAALQNVTMFFRNGGRKALIASVEDNSAGSILGAAGERGVRSLLSSPALGIDFVCVPPAARLNVAEAAGVYSEALLLAIEQKAMLLIDAPPGPGFDAVDFIANWRGALGINDRDAALYAPRLNVGGFSNPLCASGTVAGIAARIDASSGVWKAPAGTQAALAGATPSAALTMSENDLLNQANVNAIRTFPSLGALVWGARTLSSDAEWKYLSVRRTALFIEKSLDSGLGWVVFEPNNENLWSKIRTTVGSFMEGLYRQGAFAGATQNQSYFVRCDRTTTTQNDIDNGVCNVEFGFAPLKPAEFIILRHVLRTAS